MYKKKCSFLVVNNFFLNNLYFFQTKLATCLAVEKKNIPDTCSVFIFN